MSGGKWYKQGYSDAKHGSPCDPPYARGNKHHAAYIEGYNDFADAPADDREDD